MNNRHCEEERRSNPERMLNRHCEEERRSNPERMLNRHCEERSDEAIHSPILLERGWGSGLDCFTLTGSQ